MRLANIATTAYVIVEPG